MNVPYGGKAGRTVPLFPGERGQGRGQARCGINGYRWRFVLLWLLFIAGIWQLTAGLWIPAKAALAQVLLERAWEEGRRTGSPVRPWPWADTRPVARLTLVGQDMSLIVLEDDSPRGLAFGPGIAAGSTRYGTTLISGHRDTHFKVLEDLRPGDELEFETLQYSRRFVVRDRRIFDSRTEAIAAHTDRPELILMTCYPFHALNPGGPLRYRVTAAPL